MPARLIAYSSKSPPDAAPIWRFDIKTHNVNDVVTTDTASFETVALIASANKNGALYSLCRAIRDAKETDYEALIGTEFRPE